MARRCLRLLRRAYASESGVFPAAADATASLAGPQRPRQPSSSASAPDPAAERREVDALRTELAAARLRVAELQLSQLAAHEALLRRLEETDRAAHRAATELRYTALALQCSYDLLETELRRVLVLGPHTGAAAGAACSTEEGMEPLRRAAIEAAAREMVRKNIGFRVEKVSEEPAAVSRATSDANT
ncbi:uncharacterized protein Tco025E_05422 [Trypanosoma conorhini]|uniref:Uncharacterized protein n=1 Tax=Trypanosoma conorhini TaxID=83891 RepID=A0A422PDH7_9TRYP|nr:uncharacterized protein Tco025E_05422 [Trypanosoma conorhini]RNF15764.1 hypothetical protein Tco025E_05422 [Trypanosoma conorhini]